VFVKRPGGRAVGRSAFLAAMLIGGATDMHAQDSTVAVPVIPTDTSTARPPDRLTDGRPTTPIGAMFRSFLIPGWGQATYGRKVSAGIMLGVEGLSVGMLLKISSDMEQIRSTDSPRLEDKRQQREDWAAILVFNHLMSGLEAYVSAHLYDFPGDLEMRPLPGGGTGFGVTLPLGGRR
jgi:hypothetical protein